MHPSLFLSLAALQPAPPADIVVAFSPCERELEREHSLYIGLLAKTSKKMAREGRVTLGEETFSIFLPEDEADYSAAPRPKRGGALTEYKSTYLAVDQNHDGRLEPSESYFAEFPLRIGDRMFDVVEIAGDGSSMTLRPRDGALMGAVVGRRSPEFRFTANDGSVVDNERFEGRAVLIDVWSPG